MTHTSGTGVTPRGLVYALNDPDDSRHAHAADEQLIRLWTDYMEDRTGLVDAVLAERDIHAGRARHIITTTRGPGGTHDRDRYPHNEGNADLDLFCRVCAKGTITT